MGCCAKSHWSDLNCILPETKEYPSPPSVSSQLGFLGDCLKVLSKHVKGPTWSESTSCLSSPFYSKIASDLMSHRYFSCANQQSEADTSFLPHPFCTLLYKVSLLSSEEGASVPRKGRKEIRLWPVVTGSPSWLCPRLWQKGIRKASASPE